MEQRVGHTGWAAGWVRAAVVSPGVRAACDVVTGGWRCIGTNPAGVQWRASPSERSPRRKREDGHPAVRPGEVVQATDVVRCAQTGVVYLAATASAAAAAGSAATGSGDAGNTNSEADDGGAGAADRRGGYLPLDKGKGPLFQHVRWPWLAELPICSRRRHPQRGQDHATAPPPPPPPPSQPPLQAGEGFGEAAGLWRLGGHGSSDTTEPDRNSATAAANATDADADADADDQAVTVLVFTSPTRCDPSLALLRTTVASFAHVPELRGAPRRHRLIFVCDGWRQARPGAKQKAHQGLTPPERSAAYADRIDRLQHAITAAGAGDPDSCSIGEAWCEPHWEIMRLAGWCGYGQALRAGLAVVTTALVLVVQHDYAFLQRTDLAPLARAMMSPGSDINYIALLKRAQMSYQDAVRSRSGLVVSERRVDIANTAAAADGGSNPEFESCDLPPTDGADGTNGGDGVDKDVASASLRLLELPQLYDSIHLAKTDWYRARFSDRHGTMLGIPRGQFPEDILSGHMLRRAKAEGVGPVIAEYGTYLNIGHGVQISHIDGRRFRDPSQRVAEGWPSHNPRYFPNANVAPLPV